MANVFLSEELNEKLEDILREQGLTEDEIAAPLDKSKKKKNKKKLFTFSTPKKHTKKEKCVSSEDDEEEIIDTEDINDAIEEANLAIEKIQEKIENLEKKKASLLEEQQSDKEDELKKDQIQEIIEVIFDTLGIDKDSFIDFQEELEKVLMERDDLEEQLQGMSNQLNSNSMNDLVVLDEINTLKEELSEKDTFLSELKKENTALKSKYTKLSNSYKELEKEKNKLLEQIAVLEGFRKNTEAEEEQQD